MSEMKSTALSDEILTMGLYSVHLVNLATVNGPIMSKLQQANGHDGGIVIKFVCWDASLLAKELAARALFDEVFCVRNSYWPEESGPIRLAD